MFYAGLQRQEEAAAELSRPAGRSIRPSPLLYSTETAALTINLSTSAFGFELMTMKGKGREAFSSLRGESDPRVS